MTNDTGVLTPGLQTATPGASQDGCMQSTVGAGPDIKAVALASALAFVLISAWIGGVVLTF